jgi:hypothetical protein
MGGPGGGTVQLAGLAIPVPAPGRLPSILHQESSARRLSSEERGDPGDELIKRQLALD